MRYSSNRLQLPQSPSNAHSHNIRAATPVPNTWKATGAAIVLFCLLHGLYRGLRSTHAHFWDCSSKTWTTGRGSGITFPLSSNCGSLHTATVHGSSFTFVDTPSSIRNFKGTSGFKRLEWTIHRNSSEAGMRWYGKHFGSCFVQLTALSY